MENGAAIVSGVRHDLAARGPTGFTLPGSARGLASDGRLLRLSIQRYIRPGKLKQQAQSLVN